MKFIRCTKDSWNSGGPQGIKQYDRETLLGLRDSSAARARPINLPDLPGITLKTPLLGNGMGLLGSGGHFPVGISGPMVAGGMGDKGIVSDWRNGNDPFSPGYVKSARSTGNVTKRGSQQGKKEVKNITIHIPKDIKLRTSDNAWVSYSRSTTQSQEEEDHNWVIKRVRSILNKLTPENFNALQNQMENITIDTEEKLTGVTDLVFEKAILEPNFGTAYAKFCKFLMMLRVPSSTNPEQNVNFRSLLLTTCQKEFEKDSENEQKILDKKALLKKAESEGDKKQLLEQLDEEMVIARHRSVGNIRFIGELFKMNMLTEKIMHNCLYKLSCSTDEERLECFCSLLSSIGQILENKSADHVDQYFNNVQKIITDKKITSRIRFMIMDLIDLRRRNWVPRHTNKGPKTLEELHQDIQNEQMELRQKIDAAATHLTANQRNRGGRAGSMGPPAPPQAHDGEGWNTVSSRLMRTQIDPKLWLPKPCKIDDNVQLIPGVGANKFCPWACGSTGGGGRGSRSDYLQNSDRQSAPANRFSALSGDDDDATAPMGNVRGGGQENRPEMFGRGSMRRDGGRSGGTPGQSGRGQFNSSRGKTISRRFSQEDRNNQKRGSNDNLTPLRGQSREEGRSRRIRSRENSRNRTLHTPMGSRENSANRQSVLHSRENSRDANMYSRENGRLQDSKVASTERSNQPVKSHSTKEQPKQMSDEEIEKKIAAIIDEYLNIKDLGEAIMCVSELKCLSNFHITVSTAISHVLDMTEQSRKLTGNLFYSLIVEKILPHSVYITGLKQVMEYAEDLEIDIPKIWTYLAELISPVLAENGFPWDFLTEIADPLKESKKGGDFIAALLTNLVDTMGENKVREFWSAANLKLSDFTETDATTFITKRKLEFILDKESPESKLNSLQRKLHSLLQDSNCKNEAILDLIDTEISEPVTKTGEFIRILMTEICSSAIVGEGGSAKVKKSTINGRCVILVKFLDHQLDLQLHALYALQALDLKMEHPPNVLRIMFEILYDEDVILEEAYFNWEKSEDSAEQEGKGVALKLVMAFLNWLHEAEDDDDEDDDD